MKNNKNNKNVLNQFLEKVKSNKKYKTISEDIVLEEIKKYLKRNTNLKLEQQINKKSISEIRKQLHLLYSSFQTKKKKKIKDYFNQLKQSKSKKELIEITNKLLSTTLSTKERLECYNQIYKQIFKITNKPKTIIDLGAGFNIFSFPYMGLNKLTYYSYDINKEDIKLINQYIDIIKPRGLSGKAEILNIKDIKQLQKLPKSDIIFLFKVIDIIDKKDHKPSEQLITYLFKQKKAKNIVISFATRTITRRKMNFPIRKWFELMLKRNNLKFKTIKTSNEIFYITYR